MPKVISCLFLYAKRSTIYNHSTGKVEPLFLDDGTPRYNDNWLNFNQVISCYWEVVDNSSKPVKQNLNVFLNGGSIHRSKIKNEETGEFEVVETPRSGYTVVLPYTLGAKFINQFYEWSKVLSAESTPQPKPQPRLQRSTVTSSRFIKEEDFNDPEAVPEWEAPAAE